MQTLLGNLDTTASTVDLASSQAVERLRASTEAILGSLRSEMLRLRGVYEEQHGRGLGMVRSRMESICRAKLLLRRWKLQSQPSSQMYAL